MVLVSYSGKEINAKLVYYGPGLSGKTTNLEQIYGSIPQTHRGKMVSMKTKTERTLFFDFLPVNLGELAGFKTRFLLYTVPGQVYYNATRKLVLKGVDAVVFVADSKRGKMDENVESLDNLKENLRENGLTLDTLPWVIQYNKRDLPDCYTIDELQQVLNPLGVPYYEAVATNGQGVVETFKAVSKLLLRKLSKEVGAPILANKSLGDETGTTASAPPTAPLPAPTPITAVPPTLPAAPNPIAAHYSAPPIEAPSAMPTPAPRSNPFEPSAPQAESPFTRGSGLETGTTSGAPARSLGITRGVDSFESGATQAEPAAPMPPVQPLPAGGSDGGVSMGDRLRRWLGRKETPAESAEAEAAARPWATAPAPLVTPTSVPDLSPPRGDAPVEFSPGGNAPTMQPGRTFELDAGNETVQPGPASIHVEMPEPEGERSSPGGPLAPPLASPAATAGSPRTVVVPVEISPEDLESGVTLKLEFRLKRAA